MTILTSQESKKMQADNTILDFVYEFGGKEMRDFWKKE